MGLPRTVKDYRIVIRYSRRNSLAFFDFVKGGNMMSNVKLIKKVRILILAIIIGGNGVLFFPAASVSAKNMENTVHTTAFTSSFWDESLEKYGLTKRMFTEKGEYFKAGGINGDFGYYVKTGISRNRAITAYSVWEMGVNVEKDASTINNQDAYVKIVASNHTYGDHGIKSNSSKAIISAKIERNNPDLITKVEYLENCKDSVFSGKSATAISIAASALAKDYISSSLSAIDAISNASSSGYDFNTSYDLSMYSNSYTSGEISRATGVEINSGSMLLNIGNKICFTTTTTLPSKLPKVYKNVTKKTSRKMIYNFSFKIAGTNKVVNKSKTVIYK